MNLFSFYNTSSIIIDIAGVYKYWLKGDNTCV